MNSGGFGKDQRRREFAERREQTKQEFLEHQQLLARVSALRDTLIEDLKACEALAFGNCKTESGGRAFVRAVFALIEGGVFGLKQIALHSPMGKDKFSQSEITLLQEKTFELDDNGSARELTKFIPLIKNIKFAFAASARTHGVNYKLDTNTIGW